MHDLGGVGIVPPGHKPIRYILDDLPIGAAALQRLEDLIESLHASLGAGEGPLLFEAGTCGQNYICIAAGWRWRKVPPPPEHPFFLTPPKAHNVWDRPHQF